MASPGPWRSARGRPHDRSSSRGSGSSGGGSSRPRHPERGPWRRGGGSGSSRAPERSWRAGPRQGSGSVSRDLVGSTGSGGGGGAAPAGRWRALAAAATQGRDTAKGSESLEQMLQFEFPVPELGDEELLQFLTRTCARAAPLGSPVLVAKFCNLMATVVHRHKLVVPQETLDRLLRYLATVLRGLDPRAAEENEFAYNALRALGSLVFDNGSRCWKFYDEYLAAPKGLLLPFADSANPDYTTRRAAIYCIGGLVAKSGSENKDRVAALDKSTTQLLSLLLANLQIVERDVEDFTVNKYLSTTFKTVRHVVARRGSVPEAELPKLLAVVKAHMFHSILDPPGVLAGSGAAHAGYKQYDPLHVHMPQGQARDTPMPSAAPPPLRPSVSLSSRKPPDRLGRSVAAESLGSLSHGSDDNPFPIGSSSASESELSDANAERRGPRRRVSAALVRQTAVMCAQKIIQCAEKRAIYGYWQSFVPDSSSTGAPSIFTTITNDPTPRGRASGLSLLTTLLDGAKKFLASADDRDRGVSVSTFSTTLGAMVRECHTRLLACIRAETSMQVLAQAVKCLEVLVDNTTYERLQPRYLHDIVASMQQLLLRRDVSVQVAAMSCLGKVFSVLPDPSMFAEALVAQAEPVFDLATSQRLSVLDTMLWFSQRPQVPPRLEALQALCTVLAKYPAVCQQAWAHLVHAGHTCMGSSEATVRLHGLKLVEGLGKSVAPSEGQQAMTATDFWLALLERFLPGLFEDEAAFVRAGACDCLSSIGSSILDSLPTPKKYFCITLLLGLAADANASVKAAAIRATGVFVLYGCLRVDPLFVADTATALMDVMQDKTLSVRVRASWALGNLCDALILNLEAGSGQEEGHHLVLRHDLFLRLCSVAHRAADDNDKVRSNAVRALGNLARLFSEADLAKEAGSDLLNNMVATLARLLSSGSAKVRWNTACALGNVFRSELALNGTRPWTAAAFGELLAVIRDSANFKVRINAVAALVVPRRLDQYGGEAVVLDIVKAARASLESIDSMTDFSEFKYQATLRSQLHDVVQHAAALCAGQPAPPSAELQAALAEAMSLLPAPLDEPGSGDPFPGGSDAQPSAE